jgi:hypothetical protein
MKAQSAANEKAGGARKTSGVLRLVCSHGVTEITEAEEEEEEEEEAIFLSALRGSV